MQRFPEIKRFKLGKGLSESTSMNNKTQRFALLNDAEIDTSKELKFPRKSKLFHRSPIFPSSIQLPPIRRCETYNLKCLL